MISHKKPKIVTIGWWNGHSNLLAAIRWAFLQNVELSAIVSMSDDGRTTGRLMRYFTEELGVHFPPSGDVRRCLYCLSGSAFHEEFEQFFETVIEIDVPIGSVNLWEIARSIGAYEFLERLDFPYFDVKLPLKGSIDGHKFWNILTGALFYHLDQNYQKMMDFMHDFLKVCSRVVPVTTDSAYIQATLDDGTIIERQDNISNNIGYTGRIIDLSLMPGSETARHNQELNSIVSSADYIIIAPGDIYTSTISNLIIGGVSDLIKNYSTAKIIFIANTTNKGGESAGYSVSDFVNEIEKYLGKNIDILVANNAYIALSEADINRFKSDRSVKGGDYIFISEKERQMFTEKGMTIVEGDIIDRDSLYKHDRNKIAKILEEIIFHHHFEK